MVKCRQLLQPLARQNHGRVFASVGGLLAELSTQIPWRPRLVSDIWVSERYLGNRVAAIKGSKEIYTLRFPFLLKQIVRLGSLFFGFREQFFLYLSTLLILQVFRGI